MQAPNFTQNFNRYSYCLNNPLVYVDEDGEFFFIPILVEMAWGALIGAATSAAIYTVQSAFTGFKNWNWSNFGMSALMGGVGGALGGGLGALGFQLGNLVKVWVTTYYRMSLAILRSQWHLVVMSHGSNCRSYCRRFKYFINGDNL